MKLKYEREDWGTVDQRWLGSQHGANSMKGVMLDISDSDWVEADHFPDGFLLSGILLIETATQGFWRPYVDGVDALTADTVFPLYNGGQPVVEATRATDPDLSAAIMVHGMVRAQFLPGNNESLASYAMLGKLITLTPAA